MSSLSCLSSCPDGHRARTIRDIQHAQSPRYESPTAALLRLSDGDFYDLCILWGVELPLDQPLVLSGRESAIIQVLTRQRRVSRASVSHPSTLRRLTDQQFLDLCSHWGIAL